MQGLQGGFAHPGEEGEGVQHARGAVAGAHQVECPPLEWRAPHRRTSLCDRATCTGEARPQKAGGNASMQSTREDLKKAGVPLACNEAVGLVRGEKFGVFEYLADHCTKGAPRDQYRLEQKTLSEKFTLLSEAEKEVFHARARVKRQAKVPVAPTSETPQEQYNRLSTLFELSSAREIIRN